MCAGYDCSWLGSALLRPALPLAAIHDLPDCHADRNCAHCPLAAAGQLAANNDPMAMT